MGPTLRGLPAFRYWYVSQPLHPNLARLAASYDEIFERFSLNRLNAAQARVEISALVARDDDGILWSIDPDSGQWLRRAISGKLVPSTPPTYGLATATAHDMSQSSNAFNPDSRVAFVRVDEDLLHAPSSLSGATRRPLAAAPPRAAVVGSRQLRWIAAVCAVAVVVGLWSLTRPDGGPASPDFAPRPVAAASK
jgi:hypothetical protein